MYFEPYKNRGMKDTQNKFKTSKEKEEEFISKHFHFNNKKNANADKNQ